uniref:Mastoparan-S n=1 Tax=Sphodromantis viridis TaxID=267111 RepID=MAST_SPHVI|nr:RecName: Full=Mastoparan-S [Sphodromantis viridis]
LRLKSIVSYAKKVL